MHDSEPERPRYRGHVLQRKQLQCKVHRPASLAAMLGDRVETVMSTYVHKTQLGMDRAASTMSQLLRKSRESCSGRSCPPRTDGRQSGRRGDRLVLLSR